MLQTTNQKPLINKPGNMSMLNLWSMKPLGAVDYMIYLILS